MNTKLTLSLDKYIIDSAKQELVQSNQSLSCLVEDYFRALLTIKKSKPLQTPIVAELKGLLTSKKKDSRETITDYLMDKYQ